MKKNNGLLSFLIILLTTVSLTIYSCNKEPESIETEEKTSISDKITAKELSVAGIQGNKEMGIAISNDPIWKALKKTSDELTAMLVFNKIDLNDEKILDEKYFYSKLGKDADKYSTKLKRGKELANQLVSKYFPTYDVCAPCVTLTPEKIKSYAKKLDEIKAKANSSKKATMATTSSEYNGESCWNWQFFACGGICAATIEAPPLFALCVALCVDSYCK